jgi:NTP pyrophosphatase (non-canonical NTP hydrolase)
VSIDLEVPLGYNSCMNMFKKIIEWNRARGLIDRQFNHKIEASFIIEEVLESTGNIKSEEARERALAYADEMIINPDGNPESIVDALGDIIVYATGAMGKLGYDPSQVMEEVYKEINSRTGTLIDGKFVKDQNAERYTADFTHCKLN